MKVTVRPATAEDISAIYVLLCDMHAEAPIAYPPVHPGVTIGKINVLTHSFLCAVAEVDGIIVGAVGARPTTFWWADPMKPTFVGDDFLYVAPAWRKSDAFRRLMRVLRRYAKETVKLPLITGPTQGERIDVKERLYRRTGLRKIGALFTEGF